jgi:type IV pilus assembly protein PilY1
VFDGLPELTRRDYNHRFFVDGSPAVGDVQFPSGSRAWRTLLAAGLGAGGQGIFVLDVTDPDGFGADDLLFEFTDENDADLGMTFARPQIVRTNRNADPDDPDSGDWAVVFGNGYNSTAPDAHASSSGDAVLFIVFLDDAASGNTIQGRDVIKLTTASGSPENPNGLGPTGSADIDGDDRIDAIYAGDLRGNLWKFDVSASNAAAWSTALGRQPLFSTFNGEQATQPITAAPLAVPHPLGIGQGALVLFGTGRYLGASDLQIDSSSGTPASTTQSFYAVWDRDLSPLLDDATSGIDPGQLAETRLGGSDGRRTVAEPAAPDWLDEQGEPLERGWYVDLPAAGERIVQPAVSRSGVVFLVTLVPSSDLCRPGGTGFLMALDAGTGGVPNPDGGPDPIIFDVNGDGVFDEFDNLGDDAVIGFEQPGIPAIPALIYDPRSLCEREPQRPECDIDGDGVPDVGLEDVFPPALNAPRACGSEGTRLYLYTTTSNGAIDAETASLSRINCGRQAWQQLR